MALVRAGFRSLYGVVSYSPLLRFFSTETSASKPAKPEKKAKKKKGDKSVEFVEKSKAQELNDAWSVPMVIDKEKAIAMFSMEEPAKSVVMPAPKHQFLTPGVFWTESTFEFPRRKSYKQCMYLPVLTTEVGDVHVFLGKSKNTGNALVLSTLVGVKSLYPFEKLSSNSHVFNSSFRVDHLSIQVENNSKDSALPVKNACIEILQKVEKQAENVDEIENTTEQSWSKIQDKKKTATISRNICFHLDNEKLTSILANRQNTSDNPEIQKINELIDTLSSKHKIGVIFYFAFGAESYKNCPKQPPRFGMRSLYHEWSIAASRMAREKTAIIEKVSIATQKEAEKMKLL